MAKTNQIAAGKKVTIKAGTLVNRAGRVTKRSISTIVTARRVESARGGKVRVYWKSNGVSTYANLSI